MYEAFSHSGKTLCSIKYGPDDFTHWEVDCSKSELNVDILDKAPLYNAVTGVYQ